MSSSVEVTVQGQPHKFFNLYPDVLLIVDSAQSWGYNNQGQTFQIKGQSWNMSKSSTDLKFKTNIHCNAGQLTFTTLHKDCQTKVKEGDRVRLSLGKFVKNSKGKEEFEGIQVFAGIVFARKFKNDDKMDIMCYDLLRYLKAQVTYTKTMLTQKSGSGSIGLYAHQIFQKVCQDLKLPYNVVHESNVPIPPKLWDMKPAFEVLNETVLESLRLDPSSDKKYYMIRHNPEPYQRADGTWDYLGRLEFVCRNYLKIKNPQFIIGSNSLLIDYDYETSIDKQTFTRIIVYKNDKTWTSVSKKGKVTQLKKGRKTGTRTVVGYPDINTAAGRDKAKNEGLWGFLPYYFEAGDGWTESQMQTMAQKMFDATNRVTQELHLQCYAIIGLMAGDLITVKLDDIAGTTIAGWRSINIRVSNNCSSSCLSTLF